MKYLGIDYGAKKIGIALSDQNGIMAFPHTVIENDEHTIATITHNLGYKPVVYFYWSTGGNYGQEAWIASQASPHICWELISYNVTTTTLNLNYWYFPSMTGDNITGLGGTNFSFKYYIMIDRT